MAAPYENPARRGDEVRCPACCHFKPLRGSCPQCSCGELPPERFGAARTLFHAGVDRFALAERVAALEPRQAEAMERAYAEQWVQVQPLLEDVRRCEAHLLQEGFVEEEAQQLVAMLPMNPSALSEMAGPQERSETLEALFRDSPSWMVRRLAALALVHQGNLAPKILYTVHSCLSDEGRMGVEAVLALTRWSVWRWTKLGRDGWKRVRELARKALSQPELAPRAAVACVRASGDEAPEVDVLFALRLGLNRSDPDERFECALCLQDEARLMAALDSSDAERIAEARRVLASLGSSLLFKRLASEGGNRFARDVVSRLGSPVPPEALEALLSASERGPDRLEEALRQLIEGQPFAQWSEEAQARWRTWARSVLPELPGEAALRFLRWAGEPPVEPGAMRAFVEATAEALAREPADVRARSLGDAYLSRFLALAGPAEEPLLNRWAREAECAPPLMEALMVLTSRIQDWKEPKGQAARLLMAVWEGPGRESLLEPLRKSVRGWSGIGGREELIDAVWARFQRHPEERADLLSVFAPWRQELWERQLAAPDDAVARFEAWWRVDPEGLVRQADLLMRESPVDELPRRVWCVLAAVDEVVAVRPRTASVAAFYAAAALANAFRSGEDGLAPEVKRFLKWFPPSEDRMLSAPGEEEDRAPRRVFQEELQTEVRLMRERLEAMQEDEDQKWQQELQRRVEESRRRDQERQARAAQREAEEAQRQAEEARLAAEEARRAMEAQRAVEGIAQATLGAPHIEAFVTGLRPRLALKPIDSEPIFPGKPLPTLLDYVRLLKELGQGDPMKALATAGIEITTWAAVVTAWGQALTGRMELGMRFGELMGAPWE